MNWYRPYRGAGIKVTKLADDFSSATVQMPLRGFNTNYVGVHFGGSLYSMIDPFFMLLVMNQLGRDYVVWDIEANIKFISPGKRTVSAQFNVTPEQIQKNTYPLSMWISCRMTALSLLKHPKLYIYVKSQGAPFKTDSFQNPSAIHSRATKL